MKGRRKMLNFNFLLEATPNPLPTILLFGGFLVLMYFLMIRPQKKQEKKDAEMRNALAVGDEVTTIGGIIGKVVSIKEETFVLETTKDRTKIRFLRGAIRSVDVKIADIAAAQAAEKTVAETETTEENK
jgi:preprotein translocase subunit YajC